MSIQQVPGLVEQFNANLRHVIQQEGSALQKLVRQELMEHEVEHFTTLETVEALDRGKHADTGYNIADTIAVRQIPMQRRQLTAQMIYWNACLDRGDNLNLLADPRSHYTKDAGYAMGRHADRKIIAAFGRAAVGKRLNAGGNGIEAAFPFLTASHIVPLHATLAVGAAAANGDDADEVNAPATSVIMGATPALQEANRRASKLTIRKLMEARQRLKRAYPSHGEKFHFICTVEQITDLLEDPSVTSIDYNTVRALVSGDVNSFMGFAFTLTDLLPARIGLAAAALGELHPLYVLRDCYAFAESAVIFGRVKGAFFTKIGDMPQNHYAHSIYVSDSIGAVRMEDKGVVCVKCATPYNAADHGTLGLLAADGADADACNAAARALFA